MSSSTSDPLPTFETAEEVHHILKKEDLEPKKRKRQVKQIQKVSTTLQRNFLYEKKE